MPQRGLQDSLRPTAPFPILTPPHHLSVGLLVMSCNQALSQCLLSGKLALYQPPATTTEIEYD